MDYQNNLHTSDSVPLSEILQYGNALLEEYAQAPRPFQSLLGRVVDSRTFRKRVGESAWEKSGEGERGRIGSNIKTYSMAFTIDEFKHAVGWTRNEVEDNPAGMLREDLEMMVMAADNLIFEETFKVMDKGIADGTELEWFQPPSPGQYNFAQDHDHVFTTTDQLFGDATAHTLSEHVHKSAVELQHHKYNADVAFINPELAYKLLTEQSNDLNWQIREARDLLTTPLPEIEFNIGGTRVVQTAEVPADTYYLFDTRQKPLYYNWVRPVEIAQENGAPVVDPADMLGAFGSARFGVKMANPFAGVKVTPDNIA